jgi:hypothetical protein
MLLDDRERRTKEDNVSHTVAVTSESWSPTVRVDGRDLFPAPVCDDWRLGCRVYATPEGLSGFPSAEMLREALKTKGAGGANRDL